MRVQIATDLGTIARHQVTVVAIILYVQRRLQVVIDLGIEHTLH